METTGSNLLSHEWIDCGEPGSQIRRLIDTMTTSCQLYTNFARAMAHR